MVHVSDGVAAVPTWRLGVEGLGIRHKRRWVLRDLTWEHRPGRIAWVVGENGAGKSSLLRVLAGRARPDAGSARTDGPTGTRPAPILYYHPGMRLPPHLRVRDWRRLTATLSDGAAPPFTKATLEPDVPPDRRLDRLSTGEAKRLLLSVLLECHRPFLILDEPYEHLSPEARDVLTAALIDRAWSAVVVVATNQPVPDEARGPVLRLDGGRPVLERSAGDTARAARS